MSLLLQISDTHFGTERPPVVDALKRLAHALRPDLVVLSGDVTQRARHRQFQRARDFMQALSVPAVLTIPGNHDLPLFNLMERVLRPYAAYQAAMGEDLEPSFSSSDILVLGVNATRARRHIDGEISDAQVQRVAQQLRAAASMQLRVVVTHQPVDVIRAEDEINLLHGAADAVRSWSAAGADIIMGGHIHLPFARPLALRYPGLARTTWIVQAGTAVSRRVRRGTPNSVNILRYAAGAATPLCSVERWDFVAAFGDFMRVETFDIALDRRPQSA